jgi:xanthine dehydrogenase large subunit
VAGERPYTDDLPELAGTLHCALGLSPVAHGRLLGIDLDGLRALPGVVAVLTAADIPGPTTAARSCTTSPSWPTDELRYLGQPVFAVVATTARSRAAPPRGPAVMRSSRCPRC